MVVVEGAGGFMIPITATQTSADLAVLLNVPIVLVVGMRLGCLNHALLTRRAIQALGLNCAGWVANCMVPEMAHLERNVATLRERLECPLLGLVPYRPPMTADETAKHLDVRPLLSL
jgi:dethiobiotin synthetase